MRRSAVENAVELPVVMDSFHSDVISFQSRKGFYGKSELQMFLISGGHIAGQFLSTNGISIQSSIKVREAVVHKDLRLGQIVYILVFCNILFFDLFHWTVSNLFFCAVFISWQWNEEIPVKDRTLFWYNHFCFPE